MTSITLAGPGVSDFTFVDADNIEESNLNRQSLWTTKDIGKHKVDVLKNCLIERYGSLNIRTICEIATEELIHKEAYTNDVVILSADEPTGIGTSLRYRNNPSKYLLIECGYNHQNASIVATICSDGMPPPPSPPSHCSWERGKDFIGPSSGPINLEISAKVSAVVLNYLSSKKQPSESLYYTERWTQTAYQKPGN